MNETSNSRVISHLETLRDEAEIDSVRRGCVSDYEIRTEHLKPTVYAESQRLGLTNLGRFEHLSDMAQKFPGAGGKMSASWNLDGYLVLFMEVIEKPVWTEGAVVQAMVTARVLYNGRLYFRLDEPTTVTLEYSPCPPQELIKKLTDEIKKESMEDKAHI